MQVELRLTVIFTSIKHVPERVVLLPIYVH